MRRRLLTLGWLALATLPAGPAGASGAWQTYLRATTFSSLIAEADTVLCATGEAGLLRFTPSRDEFSAYVREPNGLIGASLRATMLPDAAKGMETSNSMMSLVGSAISERNVLRFLSMWPMTSAHLSLR